MAESNQFFYDNQIRRFIIQFIRIFSGWQVQYGETTLKTVPVMYGDPSRQAAVILKQNSENVLNTVPAMAAYVTGLDYDRKRIQAPTHVDKRQVRMRYRDPDTGELTTEQGNAFSIDRHMPVPYSLKMKVDIWTSNTTQKLQILEQVLTLFNPSLEIQANDNYFDWTSLSTVNLTGNNWDSREVPMMGSDAISINTATFEIPIWISPPSKVKKLGVIHRVISSVYDLELDDRVDQTSGFDDNLLMGQRVRVAPLEFDVLLLNGVLTLHRYEEIVTDELLTDTSAARLFTADNTNITADDDDSWTVDQEDTSFNEFQAPQTISNNPKPSWDLVFDMFEGKICPGISQIALLLPDEINEIIGTITEDPDNPNALFYAIDTDTIPSNTLTAVTAVIDPLRSGPGTGLPVAETGQRYLLVNDIGDDENTPGNEADAWSGVAGELVAKTDDIIEFDGSDWIVVFDSVAAVDTVEYVTNLTTQIQYVWNKTFWQMSYDGEYKSGTWQLII